MYTTFAHSPRNVLVLGHHDADGVVSAAIAGAFLHHALPGARLSYASVDFHLQDRWSSFWSRLQRGQIGFIEGKGYDGVALVDFPATGVPEQSFLLYADHHDSAFRSCGATEALHSAYQVRQDKGEPIFYVPGAPSCVEVLADGLRAKYDWKAPTSLDAAMAFAHAIDQAAYPNASAAVDYGTSVMARFDALIPTLSAEEAGRTMRLLAEGGSLVDSLFTEHAGKTKRLVERGAQALQLAPSLLHPVGDQAVLIDWSAPEADGLRPVRFAEFHHTGCHYAARLEMSEAEQGGWMARVTLMRSPWAPDPDHGWAHPHLGQIAESLGGGGHPFAAGFRVTASTREEARLTARGRVQGIASLLRLLDASHPLAA